MVSFDSIPFRSRKQAAAFLGFSIRLLDRLVADGRIPAVRPSAKRVLFDEKDLVEFAESQKVVRNGSGG